MQKIPFRLPKTPLLIVTVIFDLFLILCVILLMKHTQNLLHSDTLLNLTEIVKQNRELIANRINIEFKTQQLNARRLSSQITDTNPDSYELHIALNALLGMHSEDLYVASIDGTAYYSSDDLPLNISDREYFQLTLLGTPNISEKITDRLTNNEIFVMSVPITYKGIIVGTFHKKYSSEKLYDLCIPPLFSNLGTSYLINESGEILLSSKRNNNKYSNFYSMLKAHNNTDQSIQLRKDINGGISNVFMTFDENLDKNVFYSYAKVNDIHNWYIVTSVEADAISPNTRNVIILFYVILMTLSVFFGITIIYILTLRQREQKELRYIAFEDPVTKGYTFNYLLSNLNRIRQKHPDKQWSLLAFDIDKFRYINNSLGFEYGNAILFHVHKVLRSRLFSDEIITRIWGDYFVALLCRQGVLQEPSILAPIVYNKDLTITFSGGLYPIKKNENNVRDMYEKARLAGGQVKSDIHRTIGLYDEELNRRLVKNETLKHDIQEAIQKEELLPFFQPKVNVYTERLAGAEALARWRKPDGTYVSPADFIPICESTGLIVELDMLIYDKVLRFLRERLNAGQEFPCVPISVNFSRRHLNNPDFLTTIIQKMQEYEVPSSLIEVELTESLFYENLSSMTDLSNNLKRNGIRIDMDDFGTGYSSLSMLKDVHIDVLKIDQSFLRDGGGINHGKYRQEEASTPEETVQQKRRNIIFKSIVNMATQLDIDIVVEGVETEENVSLMKQAGCSIAQGFFYSRPLTPELFTEIYTTGIVRK